MSGVPILRKKLLNDENDSWCCGRISRGSQRRHVMWPDLPQRMHDLMARDSKFSDLSRVYNSLFCSAVLHSDIGEPGFNYHQRGGPPCMRFSGHLYARMMRTSINCWFLCDSKFGKGYDVLNSSQKATAVQIAVVLRESNPLAHRMWLRKRNQTFRTLRTRPTRSPHTCSPCIGATLNLTVPSPSTTSMS